MKEETMTYVSYQMEKDNQKENLETIKVIVKGRIPKEEKENTIKVLDAFMKKNHNNIIEEMECLKTILRKCQMELLELMLFKDNTEEKVTYENEELTEYSYKNRNLDLQIISNKEIGLNISSGDFNKLEKKSQDFKSNVSILTSILEKIPLLENIKARNINEDQMLTIEMYQLFYDENPDFTDPKTNFKFQAMANILSIFAINLPHPFHKLQYHVDDKLPSSLKLADTIRETLFPFGEFKEKQNRIPSSMRNEIMMIGKMICNSIRDEEFENDLISICNIIYITRYNLYSSESDQRIEQKTNYPLEEIQKQRKLLREIETVLNKQ